MPNGDIRANLHHPVLGNITTCSIYEIIQKEIKEGKSWLRIRNQSPCNKAKDQLLRTAAEYDNFRRRSAKEQDAAFNNGVGFAVNQILTILDTLEMAANAACTDENYKKGVVMTLDKASAALTALKVEEIPAEGQPFDPNLHNAVMQKPAEDGQKSGTVVQVFQKGYKIGDRIIRHATVVVAE